MNWHIINFSQVKEVAYIEDEKTFENVGTKVANKDAGAELPNQDIRANDDEEAELPNEDEDSEFKDSDYEFSENEAEVRPTVGENVADEGTTHGAPGEVSSDGANTSEFDTGSETEDEVAIKTQIVKGETVFQRIYVCLAACKNGFLKRYRPVFNVDGYHLKGLYPGQILTAVGVDGNNDLGITNGRAWAVINDKQKRLVLAIETVLPTAEHRMCVRHLNNNFRASHIGLALKHILWAAARATTVPWWEAEMKKMKNEDEEAWKWLKKRLAKNWSRSHFELHFKRDLLLNNICESFNAAILDARDKTILSCLERIRVYVMLRIRQF
ncbi:unnamed protein product [Prunus brigantina]